jgi:AMP nucleosidase
MRKETLSKERDKIIRDCLERYTGSEIKDFQPYILLTNFRKYLTIFADHFKNDAIQCDGGMFQVVHSPSAGISFINFGLGSPAAALIMDLLNCLPTKCILFLGMCGALRHYYVVGDYVVPICSIRAEGTSNYYYPPEVPALGNFLVQRAVSQVLDQKGLEYHLGVAYTTNKRFWEFSEEFKENLKVADAHVIEMESATLFAAARYYRMSLGALFFVSDRPLSKKGVKTKWSSRFIMEELAKEHIEIGVDVLRLFEEIQENRKNMITRKELWRNLPHGFDDPEDISGS